MGSISGKIESNQQYGMAPDLSNSLIENNYKSTLTTDSKTEIEYRPVRTRPKQVEIEPAYGTFKYNSVNMNNLEHYDDHHAQISHD